MNLDAEHLIQVVAGDLAVRMGWPLDPFLCLFVGVCCILVQVLYGHPGSKKKDSYKLTNVYGSSTWKKTIPY